MQRKVYTWYFPNWHVDERNEAWHGKGWTEWEVVKCARPRFEGHKQPLVPLWGYEDESDPRVMEKKIAACKNAGIHGFLWDFYWFEDGGYRVKALEEGFLGAKNSIDFEFALMWCNHDPIYAHPASPRHRHDPLMSADLSLDGFLRATDYFIANYFSRKNYIRVEGKLYFVIWDMHKLIANFGGVRATRQVLDGLRDRVRAAGLGEMYLATVCTGCADFVRGDRAAFTKFLTDLGLDGSIRYGWPLDESDFPRLSFAKYVEDGIKTFREDATLCDLPMELTVQSGCDNSPRTVQSDMYERLGYPYTAVVVDRDVALYEKALRAAKEFMESDRFRGHFLSLACFNEWTEGAYLEPDTENGTAYLDAVKRVFNNK